MQKKSGFDWDLLLCLIENQKVIPVVGQALLALPLGERTVLLQDYLGAQLAEALGYPPDSFPEGLTLDAVVNRYIGEPNNRRDMLYMKLLGVYRRLQAPVPEALRLLAGINGFPLYLTLTPDNLMEQALDEVRYNGAANTLSGFFTPTKSDLDGDKDLPGTLKDLMLPFVYQLFGRMTGLYGDFVLTEEDTLEFLHALQTEKRPKLLFDVLRDNYLLLLGCEYPGWLARFFLRTLKSTRLQTGHRASWETLVDNQPRQDKRLAFFLSKSQVEVYEEGDCIAFVRELARRWNELHPEPLAAAASQRYAPSPAAPTELPWGGIFISYAHENLEQATRLKDALEQGGLDVWLDKSNLDDGEYLPQIAKAIDNCAVFIPLISHESTGRQFERRYLRREWEMALKVRPEWPRNYPFIQPVVIDDTMYAAEDVPQEFRELQWKRFPGGTPPPDFVPYVRQLVREVRARKVQR